MDAEDILTKHSLHSCMRILNRYYLVSTGLLRVFLFSLALGAQALTPSHYLSLSDVARLQTFLGQHFTDLQSAYYSIVGLAKLGAGVADQDVSECWIVCAYS